MGVTRVTLGEYNLIVSRTGYTGERIAYELFVHPEQAAALFRDLIDAALSRPGWRHAIVCGRKRACRSTVTNWAAITGSTRRMRASAAMSSCPSRSLSANWHLRGTSRNAKAKSCASASMRRGARPPHPGDAITDANGTQVGYVTSCSIDSDGYQLGQALIHDSANADGTAITVQTGGSSGRTPVAAPAHVVGRFPSKKKA